LNFFIPVNFLIVVSVLFGRHPGGRALETGDKKAQEIQKLQSKNEQLTDELSKSEAHVERLEKQIDASRLQGVEVTH
jgi:hypothetical protein